MDTIKIHGKDYVMVHERVKYFRLQECYDGWSIETNIEKMSENEIITKTIICDEVGKVMATGIAHETKNSSHINKTSFIENSETSSVGRALGFLGIGIDTSIASAEEVNNAIANQENKSEKQKGNLAEKKAEFEICETKKQAEDVYKSLINYSWTPAESKELNNAVAMILEKFKGEVVK